MYLPIPGYENLYEINSQGLIRSLDREVTTPKGRRILYYGMDMKTQVSYRGYEYIDLIKNKKYKKCNIHRLVAMTFIPNPENKPHVNHKDGNKLNNSVENLEWCTAKENIHHSITTGLAKQMKRNQKGQYVSA